MECLSCQRDVVLPQGTEFGEIVVCPDCGVELEVKADGSGLVFEYAPKVAEDWGE